MRSTRRKRTVRKKAAVKTAAKTIRPERVRKPTPVLPESDLLLVHVGGAFPHQRMYRRKTEKRYQEVACTDRPDEWQAVRDGPCFTLAALQIHWQVPVSIQPISLESARKIFPTLFKPPEAKEQAVHAA